MEDEQYFYLESEDELYFIAREQLYDMEHEERGWKSEKDIPGEEMDDYYQGCLDDAWHYLELDLAALFNDEPCIYFTRYNFKDKYGVVYNYKQASKEIIKKGNGEDGWMLDVLSDEDGNLVFEHLHGDSGAGSVYVVRVLTTEGQKRLMADSSTPLEELFNSDIYSEAVDTYDWYDIIEFF